jgi:hypothetical protein
MSGSPKRVPRISVIMPARNAEPTINESIVSVVAQSLADWELLIVDDRSSDQTAACADAWARRDSRIRTIEGAGAGPGAARNRALDVARGEFVLFLDADDFLRADALKTLSDAAATIEADAVFGAYERLGPDGRPLDWLCRETLTEFGLDELLERNRAPVHAQLVARSAIAEVRFDEALGAVEDWEFWIRLALRGVRWSRVDAVVADYRQGLVSRSSRYGAVNSATMQVVSRSFAAARAAGMAGACDLSESRTRRVQWTHALDIATQSAMQDQRTAMEIIRSAAASAGACMLTARDAAGAAYWLAPTANGCGPQDWRRQEGFDAYATGALEFWSALEAAGLVCDGFRESACAELALLLAPRESIVQEIVTECGEVTRVRLLGQGANGRQLADCLRARGVEVTMTNDAASVAAHEVNAGPLVVTPCSDGEFMRALGDDAAPIRWSVTQERIARQWMARLRAVLDRTHNTMRGAA